MSFCRIVSKGINQITYLPGLGVGPSKSESELVDNLGGILKEYLAFFVFLPNIKLINYLLLFLDKHQMKMD